MPPTGLAGEKEGVREGGRELPFSMLPDYLAQAS